MMECVGVYLARRNEAQSELNQCHCRCRGGEEFNGVGYHADHTQTPLVASHQPAFDMKMISSVCRMSRKEEVCFQMTCSLRSDFFFLFFFSTPGTDADIFGSRPPVGDIWSQYLIHNIFTRG